MKYLYFVKFHPW